MHGMKSWSLLLSENINFVFQILSVSPSAALDALCLCRQHATSLAAVSGQTAVNNWLQQYHNSHLVKNKDVLLKQEDFFQTFREIVNKKDLNFISVLETSESCFNLFCHDFKQCDNLPQKQSVDKQNNLTSCVNVSSPGVERTHILQAESLSRDVKSSGSNEDVRRDESEPLQFETSEKHNAGSDKHQSDSHLPSLEQLDAVKEYYLEQVSNVDRLLIFNIVLEQFVLKVCFFSYKLFIS